MAKTILFENQTADGTSAEVGLSGRNPLISITSGSVFDGAEITIQIRTQVESPDTGDIIDTGWMSINNAAGETMTITEPQVDIPVSRIPHEFSVRLSLTGAGASTDVDAIITY